MNHRPTLAVVHPYWTFWEHTAAPTFRADRLALGQRIAASFDDLIEPVLVADVASVEEGAALGRDLEATTPDAILVLMSMAVPPAYVLAALEALPRVPVVIWAVHERGLVDGDFDHGGITTQGATVGAPMLTNMLSRQGRPFELILGRVSDESVTATVREWSVARPPITTSVMSWPRRTSTSGAPSSVAPSNPE